MYAVSIIIPIYNVEEHLEECLNSIVGIDGIEIILINDCTPDNSMVIAHQFSEKHKNIVILNHDINQGVSTARNNGLKKATGKYIFFLDSDDFLNRKKLKSFISTLYDTEVEQVLISFLMFDQNGALPLWYVDFYKQNNNKVLTNKHFDKFARIVT